MTTMNISLPDEMQEWVEDEVKQGGFAGASEFFHQLVRDAKARKEDEKQAKAGQAQLEVLLIEGLESEPEVADDRWWANLRAEMETELTRRGGRKSA